MGKHSRTDVRLNSFTATAVDKLNRLPSDQKNMEKFAHSIGRLKFSEEGKERKIQKTYNGTKMQNGDEQKSRVMDAQKLPGHGDLGEEGRP
jgi:hypothetical protein